MRWETALLIIMALDVFVGVVRYFKDRRDHREYMSLMRKLNRPQG